MAENFDDFLIDLDQIDIETVHLILDILENYKIFKLCIFVCRLFLKKKQNINIYYMYIKGNRYKLSSRISRYLVSIAHKYSSIASGA